jgi:phosphatidylethanolamine-binding protein (PEBP) family uncharacterized protein
MPLTITSPAFRNGEVIPTRHTRDGENLSPLARGQPSVPIHICFSFRFDD